MELVGIFFHPDHNMFSWEITIQYASLMQLFYELNQLNRYFVGSLKWKLSMDVFLELF